MVGVRGGWRDCLFGGSPAAGQVVTAGEEMTERWGVKWHVGIMWDCCKPLLFFRRQDARKYIESEYGYIKHRKDLRSPPHNWRLPKAVKVEVIIREPKP